MAYGINGELVSDDRSLTRTTGLDFNGAPVGITGGLDLNGAPARPMGLQPMPAMPDFNVARQQLGAFASVPLGAGRTPSQQSSMYYSPSTGEMVVNGFAFNERNASAALASREAAAQPTRDFQLPDTATDWRPMAQSEYDTYINDITNPGFGRRIAEGWEHGWRGYGDTNLGALLAVDPDNEWALTARQSLAREFEENAPFVLGLRDVQDVGSATEYTAQMMVQGVPWMIDTIAWMAAGALVGGATSAGVGAPAGALSSFAAREAFRRAASESIRQTLGRGAAAYVAASRGGAAVTRDVVLREAAQTGIASVDDVNRFFDFSERAYHFSRGGGRGATGFAFAGNYETGVGEIRNAIADSGADPTSADSVANIWGMALPYAAVETLGDLIITQPISRIIPSVAGVGGSRVGNALRHGAVGMASEGAEEGMQYGITQQAVANANNQPIDIDPYDLLENVVGGALGGAPFAAAAGALGPVNRRPAGTTLPSTPPANPPAGLAIGEADIPEYPGGVFNEEPLAVTQPSATNLPLAPPVIPGTGPSTQTNVGLMPPELPVQEPTAPQDTPEQRATYHQGAAESLAAMQRLNHPVAKTINNILGAMNSATFVSDDDLASIRNAAAAAMPELPENNQILAVSAVDTLIENARRHNQYVAEDLRDAVLEREDIANWDAQRLVDTRALIGNTMLYHKKAVTNQLRPLLEDVQDRIRAELQRRSAPPKPGSISVPNQNKVDALLGEAKQAIEDGTLDQLTDEKLNQLSQVAKRDLKLKAKLVAEINRRRKAAAEQRKEEGRKATRAERDRENARREAQAKETGVRQMGDMTYTPSEEVDFEADRKGRTAAQEKHSKLLKSLMSKSEEELRALRTELIEKEDKALDDILGEGGAKKFRRLDRLRNSNYPDTADKAQEEFNKYADKFTEEQDKEIFGDYLNPVLLADEVDEFIEAYTDADALTPEQLARVAMRGLDEKALRAVMEGTAYAQQYADFLRMQLAREGFKEAGVATSEIPARIAKEMVSSGYASSAAQAKELVGYFVEAVQNVGKQEPKVEAIEGDIVAPFTKEERATIDEFFDPDHAEAILGEMDPAVLYEDGKDMFDRGETVAQQLVAIKLIEHAASLGDKNARRYVGKEAPQSKVALTAEARARADELLLNDERGGNMSLYSAEERMLMEARMNEKYGDDRNKPHEYGSFDPVPDDIEAWVAEVTSLSDDEILARINELVKEANQLARRKADVINFAEARERINKVKQNVQERSTEAVSTEEQAGTGKGARSADTARDEAPAKAADTKNDEGVSRRVEESIKQQREEAAAARIESGYKALLANTEGLKKKDAAQRVRAVIGVLDRDEKINLKDKKNQWTVVNKTPLTKEELKQILAKFPPREKKPNQTKSAKKEAKASFNIGEEIAAEYRDSREQNTSRTATMADKTSFVSFRKYVADNADKARAWLLTNDATMRRPVASAVEQALRDIPPDGGVSRADGGNWQRNREKTRSDKQERLWQLIRSVRTFGRRGPQLPTNWRALVVEKSKGEFTTERQVTTNLELLMRADNEYGEAARKFFRREDLKPSRANTGTNQVVPNPIGKNIVADLVRKVQSAINQDIKFRDTFVYKDAADFWKRINTDTMTTNWGTEMTVGQFIMRKVAEIRRERPDLKEFSDKELAVEYAYTYLLGRAVVIHDTKTMLVFSDHIGSERELVEVLEHEYIVHNGLRVIFKTREEREMFLRRLWSIPGMEAKRRELLVTHPGYRNIPEIEQIEELVAFHGMNGPLALEKLLSAPQAVDPVTKRTLWQDFKRLVSEWLDSMFGVTRSDADKALDRVVSHLREYAMTRQTGDINRSLSDFGALTEAGVIERMNNGSFTGDVSQAIAATATSEDVVNTLFGTPNNPAQPYKPTGYREQLLNTLKSNQNLFDKAKEVQDRNIATPIKEGWKKIGRNIETMINMSQRSMLVQKLMYMMHETIKHARRIMSEIDQDRTYATKAEEFAGIRKIWGDKAPGSTREQRTAYNRMAIAATLSKMPLTSEEIVRAAPRLIVRQPNGAYIINMAVFDELVKQGTFTKEEFQAGIPQYTVDKEGNVLEVKGKAEFDEATIEAGYDIYVKETRNMAISKLKTLEAAITMLGQMNDTAVVRILRENNFAAADQAFVTEVLQKMHKVYTDIAFHNITSKSSKRARSNQKERARQVLAELMRAFHEKEKVTDWTDGTKARDPKKNKNPRKNDAFKWRDPASTDEHVKPFIAQIQWFLTDDPVTGLKPIERINTLGVNDNRQFAMLGVFQNLLNVESDIVEHENSTIQTILGNYVELTREGDWRVFINVVNAEGKEAGKRADIDSTIYTVLPVTYPKTEREAKALQEERQAELNGVFETLDSEGNTIKVKFDVGYGKAPGTATLPDAPNLKQFMEVADIVGLALKADQMKVIANLIEDAGKRKRFGLQRAGTPGMDLDVLKSNSLTITRNAWYAAKMAQAWMMDQIFADRKNLYGDPELLQELQNNFDIADRGAIEGQNPPSNFVRNEAAVYIAETTLLRYANQMRYMSNITTSKPTIDIRTTAGKKSFKIEPEAEAHLDHATALRDSLERDILELNLNDLLSKTGPLRMLAVVMQLGSIASGIMNAFTLMTHLPMVLTARHKETGYGEGFELSEVTAEIIKATTQVGKFWANLPDSAKIKELLDEAKKGNNNTGLTLDELEFLYKETLEGLLMPQQTYSATGGTESNISNLVLRNIAEGLLTPFSSIEAMNRRIAALATYRLAKARYLKAGISEAKLNDTNSFEYKRLIGDIETVVFLSQGDYANVNRPKAFRGDLAQYVLMYKMFPLMTTLMLYNLPRPQQAAFLAVLFLLGGLKAEPFAEDFMDLYDTLLQKLGFRHNSVELQLTRKLEEIMPGSSGWVMHGFIDNLAFGGTMSSRVSMGDILPMTGAFREGADLGREIQAAFGPAYSANVAALDYAGLLTNFTAQVLGLKADTTDWRELIRKMPQAQLRGLGEAGLMAADGEITDPRGRLVSDEVHVGSIFARALGFYPLEATRANTAVRLDRMHIGYMRNVRARYILAYAQAYRQGDQARMDSVTNMVNEWNTAAREANDDTMLIRNFRSAAVRAGRAAAGTTIERTSDAAPDYSLIDELAEIMNADTESEE